MNTREVTDLVSCHREHVRADRLDDNQSIPRSAI